MRPGKRERQEARLLVLLGAHRRDNQRKDKKQGNGLGPSIPNSWEWQPVGKASVQWGFNGRGRVRKGKVIL